MMKDDIPKACWGCGRVAKIRECNYFEKYQEAVYKMDKIRVLYPDVIRVDFQPVCSKRIGIGGKS